MSGNIAPLPRQSPAPMADVDFPSMISMVIERGVDPAVINSLLQMYNAHQDRKNLEALNSAVADVASEVQPVTRDAVNKHLGNRYATHQAFMAMLQPLLAKHAVRVGFDTGALPGEPDVAAGCVRVRIVLGYGGYCDRASYLDEPITQTGSRGGATQMTQNQALTSATTYAQRTLLRLKFNISSVEDDDDGEGARDMSPPRDPPRDPSPPGDPLEEANGTLWLRNLTTLLKAAPTLDALVTIGGHRRVREAKSKAPLLIRQQIDDLFREAHERLAPVGGGGADDQGGGGGNGPGQTWDDPIEALLAEVEAMDAITLAALPTNAVWRGKTRELFPPDQDRIAEAIELRKAALKGSTSQ